MAAHDRAADRPDRRPVGDPAPDGAEDRPAGARLRHGDAPEQERHADHGRRAGPVLDRASRPCCGSTSTNRFVWIVLVGHAGLRRHRLGRRLAQGGAQGPGRHALARKVFLAVADRPARRAVPRCSAFRRAPTWRVLQLFFAWVRSGFDVDLPPKADLLVPFFKEVSYPLGVFGFVILTYLVIVGASNAVNLTDGLDGLAIMPVVMVGSALGVFAYVTGSAVYSQVPVLPAHPGLRRTADLLRGDGRRGPGLPLVQHPSGAGLHGRRRRAGAGRRAGHHRRDRAPGDRAGRSWAASSWSRRSR